MPSPDRKRRRDSRSPRRDRDRDYKSSSQYRSPDAPRERNGGGSSSRPRDGGYGDRDSIREREKERGSAGGSSRRGADDSYGAKDRERERALERKRYDGDVKREGSDQPGEPVVIKPDFGSSGLLAKETNTVKGVVVKYNEPPEARKPTQNWRLYVFKNDDQIDLVHIYKQSAYLIGRDEVVTDILVAHPSCSKQHAAIQYRQITDRNEFGDTMTSVKPFIIDLESTNGTFVNDIEIPKSRYYELRVKDVIKFGTSAREYVLLSEDASA